MPVVLVHRAGETLQTGEPATRGYVVVSAHQDNHAAVYAVDGYQPLATFATGKGPMGFGFAPDGRRAYLCCHDDAIVTEFELATGKATRSFSTDAGCEFVVAYH